jgi:NADPH2:quinone reductase
MRAIRVHRFGDPDVLQLEETHDLQPPRAGEVLVRVAAAGVNPVETYVRSGQYASLPELPYTPGGDAGGVVAAVGAGVAGVKPGDRVYTSGSVTGTYAEATICEAAQAHRLPDGVSLTEGAALGVPYATAFRALFQRGEAQPGETVLVHGASGSVGLAAVQFAVAAGLTTHGTAGTAAGRRLVRAQGAARVVDHRAPAHVEQLLALTAGRGYDLVVEMLANVNLGHDLGLLASGGRVVVVGSRGPVEIVPRDLMRRDADVRGMLLMVAPRDELAAAYAAIDAGLTAGTLRPVVAHEMPLERADDAHRLVVGGHPGGKVVLVP